MIKPHQLGERDRVKRSFRVLRDFGRKDKEKGGGKIRRHTCWPSTAPKPNPTKDESERIL